MVEDKSKLKPHIIYADGTFSVFESFKEIKVKDVLSGEEVPYLEFYLRPTLKARIKWDINDSDPDFINVGQHAGFYLKRYKKDYCEALDLSPDSAVWLLSCDYEGNFIDLFDGEKTRWMEKNKTLMKQNNTLKATNAKLRYEMGKIVRDPLGYMKKYSDNINKILSSSTIVVNNQGGGGEQADGTK